MIGTITGYLRWLRDQWRLRVRRASDEEDSAVMIVLFHGLFRSRGEAESGVCDPQQGITTAFFAEFVESLLTYGLPIRQLEDALRHPQPGLSAVITFDDGYANNLHALSVLEQFSVPASFFISTGHVEQQKAFWWDALYRHAARQGAAVSAIRRRMQRLKRLRAHEIESSMVQWFGPRALVPVSDCDRPFSTAELAQFARSRYVFLGNHTSDHAVLVNYDLEGMRSQIEEAQRFLASLGSAAPTSISYPNGNYDATVLEAVRKSGLEFGLTVQTGMNLVRTRKPMELRRLTIWGIPGAARQVRTVRAIWGDHGGS